MFSVKSFNFALKCFHDLKYFSYNSSIYRRKLSTNVKSVGNLFSSDVISLRLTRYYSSDTYFSINDYDCIGFDLDHTICEYNLKNTVRHEYKMLAEYLVEELGYDAQFLLKPVLQSDIDFLQKGLIIDTVKGNILRIRKDGYIFRASYGSKFLTDEDIVKCYGLNRRWSITNSFAHNPVDGWYGPSADKLRTLADYFDMPAALLLSRCLSNKISVDGIVDEFSIWKDVRQGLFHIYDRKMFSLDQGFFKTDVKVNPEKYYYKCRPDVISWLKELKKRKVTFLITGSNADHAAHTAKFCLGEDWRDYFDIVICYSRKPGFFVGNRDFIKLDDFFTEVEPIKDNDIKKGGIYSQGNWNGLLKYLCSITQKSNPKCLYIGDNLIQDIFTVSQYTCCDTVAVTEELSAEFFDHVHKDILVSDSWGSYFSEDNQESLWASIIRDHSKICIPNLDALANKPFDYQFRTFTNDSSGYHSLDSYLHDFNARSQN